MNPKKLLHKVLSLFIMLGLSLSFIPASPSVVKAENAATTTSSMLKFFRESRTSLDADKASRDEIFVYGVFLSNFFMPGQTTIKDIADDALSAKVSTKFFGSDGKKGDVQKLNAKAKESILKGLISEKDFDLRKGTSEGELLTGTKLFNLFGGVDKLIYTSKGADSGKIDLNDPAMQAVMKVLFGYAPDLIMSETKGLRGLGKLYIDGFGNIWGVPIFDKDGKSLLTTPVEDYILVLPACLNPVTFAKGNSGLKFPVANVFVMGATQIVDPNMFSNGNIDPFTPYYNITNTKGNLLNILGVASTTKQRVGNSDALFKDTSNSFEGIKKFIDLPPTSLDTSKAAIVISLDTDKYTDLSKNILSASSLDDTGKSTLVSYFNSSSTLSLDDLADDMYYFKFSASGSDSSGADWASDDAGLLAKQSMFTTNDRKALYTNSSAPSPFNAFYLKYLASSDKTAFLKQSLSGLTSGNTDIIKSFLDTGLIGSDDTDSIMSAFKEATGSKKALVYGFLAPTNIVNSILVKDQEASWKFWQNTTKIPVSFGLTSADSNVAIMSSAANKEVTDWSSSTLSAHSPSAYRATKAGGELFTVSDTNGYTAPFKDSDKNSLANVFYNFNSYRLFSMNNTVANLLKGIQQGVEIDTPRGKLKVATALANDVNNFPGIYWGYMTQMLKITKTDGIWSSTSYSNETLPDMVINTSGGTMDLNNNLDNAGVESSANKSLEDKQKDITDKVYGLLSDGSNAYRTSWIKATVDDWLISTHRALTGSWSAGVSTISAGAVSSYSSVVGYINTPSLYDMPLTAGILKNYMKLYVFLLFIISVILILLGLSNQRTWHEVIGSFLIMSVVLLLPQIALDKAITASNYVGNSIFSGRFDYWAITQNLQDLNNSLAAKTSDNSLDSTIVENFSKAQNVYSSDAGVKVKWMSPKKDDVFKNMFNTSKTDSNLATNLTIFKWLFNSFANQEEYVYNDPLATYLYRPYNDIASIAKTSYASLKDSKPDAASIKSTIDGKLSTMLGVSDYSFKLLDKKFDKVVMTKDQTDLIDKVTAYSVPGAEQPNYRLWPLASDNVTTAIFRSTYEDNDDAGLSLSKTQDPNAKLYLQYTESPYYYFYSVFKARYGNMDGGFKAALLNQQTYKVSDVTAANLTVNNKTKDFLDLEGLFTDVIPYMEQGNIYVAGWRAKYGSNIEGYDFGTSTSSASTNSAKAAIKKNHQQNVWNIYTPWVANLYSLDVMNKKVSIAKKTVKVADTLNPGSYDSAGRPMIWSEADMVAKHYNASDLSEVEMRMQRVLDSTYTDMQYLTNYHNCPDEVLIAQAAMKATFNFNREFSQTKFIGADVALYPQGFELKNFNYDAFMRLTLMNSTGESLSATKDLYVTILSKTSLFTGLLLLVEDLIAVIIIPACKMIVLLMLLFLGLLICVSSVMSPQEKILKVVWKNFLTPTLLFMLFNVAFAYVVSLFVGEGLTSYVGSRTPSIVTNDPTITIVFLIAVGVIYTFCLVKLIKMMLSPFKAFGVSALWGAVSAVAGVGTTLVNKTKREFGGILASRSMSGRHNELVNAVKGSGSSRGSYSSGFGNKQKLDKKHGDNYRDDTPYTSQKLEGRDKAYADELKELTSTHGGKKTLLNKVSDIKFGAREILDKPGEIAMGAYDATKRKGKYVKEVADGTRFRNYVEQARKYDEVKQTHRVETLENRRKAGKTVSTAQSSRADDYLKKLKDKRYNQIVGPDIK